MLDSTYMVETPEGVELPVSPAGIVVRGLALLTDFAIRVVFYASFAAILALISTDARAGLLLILFFLLEWFYPVTFEVLMDGATPGKRLLGLKVINDDGTPVSFRASLIRNLLIMADFLPSFFTSGTLCMILNRRSKRLGDLAAGTLVIHLDSVKHRTRLPADKTVRHPPFVLTNEEHKAIVGFAERHSSLSRARAAELAELLSPILTDTSVPADQQLLQIANGLMGRT